MSIIIVKYIFWVLICFPLLALALYLLLRLMKESNAIKNEGKKEKEAALAEQKKRELFYDKYDEERKNRTRGDI